MPTFGDYETVGEPIATRDERGHISTVWQARKIGTRDGRLFAIKCYAPHRREAKEGAREDALDADRGLEFLGGVKQLKQACEAGGACLAPIYDLGTSDVGVWYVTDHYQRGSLKAWIDRKGGVDSAALRHVVYSVAVGCLALKRSCGRSHGNLQASNVFLVGKPRPLRKTPLVLIDPYPASGAQMLRLDAADRQAVGELFQQVVEAHDLHDIGELILQLVEGRLILNKYDYNYPIAPSPAWESLGKSGERWRQLCNRLLDPQLSLGELSLESLAKDFRPNPVIEKLPVIVAIFCGICLLTVGGFYGKKRIDAWAADQAKKAKVIEQEYQAAMGDGNSAFGGGDYAKAITQANEALGIKPRDPAATKLRDDAQKALDLANTAKANEQKYQTAVTEWKSAFEGKDYAKAITHANVALGIKPGDPAATKLRDDAQKALDLANTAKSNEQKYQMAMTEGKSAFEVKDYAKAITQATVALGIKPRDPAATKLRDDAQKESGLADTARANQQKFQAAMMDGKTAFEGKDYAKAITQATVALGLKPGDPEATKLRDDSQRQLDLDNTAKANEQKYQTAITEGKTAFGGKDYAKAITQANAALGLKPGDPAATKLREDAQKELDLAIAAKANEQKFQTAMMEGKFAFERKDYTNAVTQANVALGIRPGDRAATKLKKDAEEEAEASVRLASLLSQAETAKSVGRIEDEIKSLEEAQKIKKDTNVDTWLVQAKEFQMADKAFTAAKYDDALKVCDGRRGIDRFELLAQKVRPEKDQLNAITVALNAGHYDAVLQAKNLPAKQPFAEVLKAGQEEQGQLIALRDLQKATNRPAVIAGLEKLKQQVREKRPFVELSQWANQQQPVPPRTTNNVPGPKQAELAKLDANLNVLEVRFKIKSEDPQIQEADGSPAKTLRGDINKDAYLVAVNKLEASYKTGGWLEGRINRLNLLRDRINTWNK